ncbi:hypothetical protein [Actinotalea sp. K2]|uniref:hypothetical protein n=1 Tax=Actinotalea sp. K2 TaxID=2939438 RepID=UPI0020179784|nr:hypothetical protein [Actinotalea sp. K2]MCL3863199.1 hypothetical protein [Actinotalea sp. K2]
MTSSPTTTGVRRTARGGTGARLPASARGRGVLARGAAALVARWATVVGWCSRLAARWRATSRARAHALMGGAAVLALAAGMGTAAGVASAVDRSEDSPPASVGTILGPFDLTLPAGLEPWEMAPSTTFDLLRETAAASGTVIDGAWGAVARGGVVVTVMTAAPGTHGGLASVVGPWESTDEVVWDGRADHVDGVSEVSGVREVMLAVELGDGTLAMLSVSGPVGSFASGELDELFRTARLVG